MKAQSWSLDFMLGLLLFTLAIVLSIKFITIESQDDTFNQLFEESKFISDQLRSEGYPANWSNQSFVRVGLMTNGKFSESKFNNLTSFGYKNSKRYLNAQYEYFVMFRNRFGKYYNFSGNCGFGSDRIAVLSNTQAPVYYFSEPPIQVMRDYYISIGADIYVGDVGVQGLDSLFNLSKNNQFDYIFMENPQFDKFSHQDRDYLVELIHNWTAKGNTLILSQNVDINNRSFLHMNFSSNIPNASAPATVLSSNYFNLSNVSKIDFRYKKTFRPLDPDHYEVLANYSNGPAIATWTYGDGRVFYFSDFNLSANYQGQSTLTNWVDDEFDTYINKYCGGVDSNSLDLQNLIKIQRILPKGQDILLMDVYVWSVRDQ